MGRCTVEGICSRLLARAVLMAMAKKGSVSTVLVRWLSEGTRPSALRPSFVARRLLLNNNNNNKLNVHPYNYYAHSDPLVKSCESSASRLSVYRCNRCIGSALPLALCLLSLLHSCRNAHRSTHHLFVCSPETSVFNPSLRSTFCRAAYTALPQ